MAIGPAIAGIAGTIGSIAPIAAAGIGIASGINSLVSSGNSRGATGSQPQGSNASSAYIPQNQALADQSFQSTLSNIAPYASQVPGQVAPQYYGQVQSNINNPYAQPGIDATVQAGQYGQNVAGQNATGQTNLSALGQTASSYAPNSLQYAQGGFAPAQTAMNYSTAALPASLAGLQQSSSGFAPANAAVGSSLSALGFAGNTLQQGYDPQKTLYNQQYQQNQDQTNAINAQNGVAGTPYAAGLDTQSAQNFNTNWQNQQLARQGQAQQTYQGALTGVNTAVGGLGSAQNTFNAGIGGLGSAIGNVGSAGNAYGTAANTYNTLTGAYGNLAGTAGNAYTAGSNLGTQGYNTLQNAATSPYTFSNTVGTNNLSALSGYGPAVSGSLGPSNTLLSGLESYLGLGQSATGYAQSGQQAGFNQGQTTGGNIGQSISGLGNAYNQNFGTYGTYGINPVNVTPANMSAFG